MKMMDQVTAIAEALAAAPPRREGDAVNTSRIVRSTAITPEICAHNVALGPGTYCPHCPTWTNTDRLALRLSVLGFVLLVMLAVYVFVHKP